MKLVHAGAVLLKPDGGFRAIGDGKVLDDVSQ